MRSKIFVGIILLPLSLAAAAADWKPLPENDGEAIYLDVESFRGTREVPRVWTLRNDSTGKFHGAKSYTLLVEFDCAGNRLRFLTKAYYAGPMATGRILSSSNASAEWKHILPATVMEFAREVTCTVSKTLY